jgi:hypothetical protein
MVTATGGPAAVPGSVLRCIASDALALDLCDPLLQHAAVGARGAFAPPGLFATVPLPDRA